ncbi:MAG: hypothetical protein GF398_14505 [Chitinivibrionales bacterium]|nr:hypothetical protein [Chitinivibrionales bacterium]
MDFDSLKTVIWLVLLVAWAISSAVRNNAKQKKLQEKKQQNTRPQEHAGGQRQQMRTNPQERQSSSAPKRLEKTPAHNRENKAKNPLESLFESLGEAIRQDLPGTPVEPIDVLKKKKEHEAARRDKMRERARRKVEHVYLDELPPPPPPKKQSPTSQPRNRAETSGLYLGGISADASIDQLQRAIIWSEILDKPVSMRQSER